MAIIDNLAALSVFCSPRSRWTMGENPLPVGVAAYTQQSYPIAVYYP
jgi:outer membrane scaffolding protein for murein synthesis (MipA/OmpV family)